MLRLEVNLGGRKLLVDVKKRMFFFVCSFKIEVLKINIYVEDIVFLVILLENKENKF